MVRAIHLGDPVIAYRFMATFFSSILGEDDQGRRTTNFKQLNDPTKMGFTSVGVSSRGFEVWRGLFHDEPSIFPVIGEAIIVECVAFGRPGSNQINEETGLISKKAEVEAKVFTFSLGNRITGEGAIHLPMAIDPLIVGATITQERGLDATSSTIVMEGVLWSDWKLVSIKDEVRDLPG